MLNEEVCRAATYKHTNTHKNIHTEQKQRTLFYLHFLILFSFKKAVSNDTYRTQLNCRRQKSCFPQRMSMSLHEGSRLSLWWSPYHWPVTSSTGHLWRNCKWRHECCQSRHMSVSRGCRISLGSGWKFSAGAFQLKFKHVYTIYIFERKMYNFRWERIASHY